MDIDVYVGLKNFDGENERKKIIDGIYPSRLIKGKQNKHIPGTIEFKQNSDKMQKASPGSEPAILNADAQVLVDKYKGTGKIYLHPSSPDYPREDIVTNEVIGKTWVKSLQKYVDTSAFTIIYSGTGVHVVPINMNRKGVII